MKQIPLTKGYFALIDDEDIERVSKHKWRALTRPTTKNVYACTGQTRKKNFIQLHRFIMNADPNQKVDHENRQTLDCQKINLRFCTHAENMRNRTSAHNSTSQFLGVSLCKKTNKWRAHISNNKKLISLGTFINEKDAAITYNQAATRLHGNFANLNKV